ncbi:MAG: D-alanyl-D-alanine carboxypeptidase/D-alanyl-D-alanine-endopeptidase [Deltaproteobacteria bacterium]|nr:D-alanyl-D-alanine carboxypeptidase/D-alanyl-D-alanine-endopeptidase [Deltaproteobacteria bacterium]
MSRALAALAALLLILSASSPGPSEDDAFGAEYAPLVSAIKMVIKEQTIGDVVLGIDVVEIASGRRIYSMHPDVPLNPASNVKIITAFAALEILKPEFTFETALYGDSGSGAVLSQLAMKGYGDPSLETDDLVTMVEALKTRGVTKISGPIIVDDTFFDDVRLPYAFDKFPKSDADSPFRAPVGAVSLNANTMNVSVSPGPYPGTQARVNVFPAGLVELRNETMTVADGTSNVRIYATKKKDGSPLMRVWGPVVSITSTRSYRKRVEDPARAAGYTLKQILAQAGITSGDVAVGKMNAGTRMLASHTSLPLGALLLRVGKNSDNFYAEQLLKVIGAEAKGKPGTADKGIEAVQEVLARAGIDPTQLTYRNGSGLYSANMVAPSHLTTVLRHAYLVPEIRPEFVAHLATGLGRLLLHRRQQGTGPRGGLPLVPGEDRHRDRQVPLAFILNRNEWQMSAVVPVSSMNRRGCR